MRKRTPRYNKTFGTLVISASVAAVIVVVTLASIASGKQEPAAQTATQQTKETIFLTGAIANNSNGTTY